MPAFFRMLRLARVLAAGLVVAAVFALGQPAAATGIARVEQSDGVVHEYRVSVDAIDHRAVRITSADRRGTLTIFKGACSYAGELERCLPYEVVLDQSGQRHTIAMQHGTEYLNRTAEAQQLPFSSHHVPPHGIELLVMTARGTYITVRGTIDRFAP